MLTFLVLKAPQRTYIFSAKVQQQTFSAKSTTTNLHF